MKTFKELKTKNLDEAFALSRAQLEKPEMYKRSLEVYRILKKNGYRLGAQGDTLVRNILKKKEIGRDPKKAAAKIMKDYPGLKPGQGGRVEEVELDEGSENLVVLIQDITKQMIAALQKNDQRKLKGLYQNLGRIIK